jgi:hypothetical protein
MKKILLGLVEILSFIIIICLPIAVSIVGLIAGISILTGHKLIKKSKHSK